MTTGDLLRAIVVRWYIALVGLVLTAGVAYHLNSSSGVFQTEVDVHFVPPSSLREIKSDNPTDDLVALAGLVERQVNVDATREQPVSPDVSLAGMGIREGTVVFLPNSGGQFNYSFSHPVLRVQSVGPSADHVVRQRDEAVAEIVATLERIQVQDEIPPTNRVRTRDVPAAPVVGYATGFSTRAVGVASLLGLALTGAGCLTGDRFIRHRRRARPAREDFAPATSA